jgi:pimeloyl-ACP methyl ester carboxylesterase
VVVGRSTLPESPGRAPYESEVVSALPNARLELVGPLTHFGPQEQPAQVATRIQSWIAGDAPASDS